MLSLKEQNYEFKKVYVLAKEKTLSKYTKIERFNCFGLKHTRTREIMWMSLKNILKNEEYQAARHAILLQTIKDTKYKDLKKKLKVLRVRDDKNFKEETRDLILDAKNTIIKK